VSVTSAAHARTQPPVAYLPCRLDDGGNVAEVMMAELETGQVALMGYTALDRFFACCGSGHPWVLWKTEELESLRELKHFDVAYLDIAMPVQLRIEDPATGPDLPPSAPASTAPPAPGAQA
jgi:hypothetical protein